MTDFTHWSKAEIDDRLRTLPAKIAWASKEEIDAETSMKKTKHILELEQASVIIEHKEDWKDRPKLTATELKALAYKATAKTREQLIEDEKTYALAKAKVQLYKDEFDSVRKSANLIQEEMRRL